MHDQLLRGAILDKSGQASNFVCSGPAAAEAQRRPLSWGSQVDLAEGSGTGSSLFRSSTARSTASSQGSEARAAVSSPQKESQTLHLSSSEEVDVMPPQSLAYEDLMEVVTRAVAKINID